jgi:hypothetical protein
MMVVVRSGARGTASLVLNFSESPVGRPESAHGDDVVFDSEDPRWGGSGVNPGTVAAWSARLALVAADPGEH